MKPVFGFLLLSFALGGCSSTSDARGARYTVVCRNEMQDCYQRCQELCPKGYLVSNRVRGVKSGDETNYTVIIRCKESPVRP